MEEMNISQIQRQIDLQVGEQVWQIKQKLLESLPKEVNWQLEEKVWEVSKKILQETGMIQNGFFTEDGYLINSEDWSIGVAEYLAKKEGLEMTDAHWEIINFMREYYEEYKIAPMIKIIIKALSKKLGSENGNIKHPYKLFSGGNQLNKIAGLQRMGGCV